MPNVFITPQQMTQGLIDTAFKVGRAQDLSDEDIWKIILLLARAMADARFARACVG